MSDPLQPPTGGADSAPGVTPPDGASGGMPRWLKIGFPIVLVVALVVGVVWALGGSGDDDATTATTEPDDSMLDEVLRGIILVGGAVVARPSDTASTAVPSTAATTTPETTAGPATTEAPASTVATATTAVPATTATPTTEVPATTAPPAPTAAPAPTEAPASTVAPDTTEAAVTTAAPATTEATVPPEEPDGLPTVAAFVAAWNDTAAGTGVPPISAEEATELPGQYAGYHLVTLSSQVGLVGTLTAPGSGQLARVLLVWIPGDDDDEASALFWQSFSVLVRAVDPGASAGDIASLQRDLGRAPDQPPFTTSSNATSDGLTYRSFTQAYDGADEPIDVSAIAVE